MSEFPTPWKIQVNAGMLGYTIIDANGHPVSWGWDRATAAAIVKKVNGAAPAEFVA